MVIIDLNDLVGRWENRNLEIKIYDSGTAVEGSEWYFEFVFEDSLLHVAEEPWEECEDRQVGIYEISGVPGEFLIFTKIDDPCLKRVFSGKRTAVGN